MALISQDMNITAHVLPTEDRPKSVKWHRLDYYDIAPLTAGGAEKTGLLSRGALVSAREQRYNFFL